MTGHVYTQEQVDEIIKCREDAVYFIEKYVKLRHPRFGAIPFILYPYQKDLIENLDNHRMMISSFDRQMGLSYIHTAYILWYALFEPDRMILVTSHTLESAKEVLDRIQFAYDFLPEWLRPDQKVRNKKTTKFDNGSTIVAGSVMSHTGRGMSISLLFMNEAAYVPETKMQQFWENIYPCIATGSKVMMASAMEGPNNTVFRSTWRNALPCENSFDAIDGVEKVDKDEYSIPFRRFYAPDSVRPRVAA